MARRLDTLGLWLGDRLDPNHESLFFLRLNEWILRRSGGAWDHPLPAIDVLGDAQLLGLFVERLRVELESQSFSAFTGGRPGPLPPPDRRRLRQPWGWKDPRNVLSWPAWSTIYPGARLVLVVRHGVDAAASLWTREQRRWTGDEPPPDLDLRPLPRRLRALGQRWESLIPYLYSTRCRSLESAFALWEEYAQAVDRLRADDRVETEVVRFEDLLADPETELRRLARFCELSPDASAVREASQGIRQERARVHTREPELMAFHEQVRSSRWLAALGYA